MSVATYGIDQKWMFIWHKHVTHYSLWQRRENLKLGIAHYNASIRHSPELTILDVRQT